MILSLSRQLVLFALVTAGCGTNVTSAGALGQTTDPDTGEKLFHLEDLESGEIAMRALGFEQHDGALFDLLATHPVQAWGACTRIDLIIDGQEAVIANVIRRDARDDRDILGNIIWHERLSFILDDEELAVLAAARDLELGICEEGAPIHAQGLQTLTKFARAVLAAHGGERYHPLVVPSDDGP